MNLTVLTDIENIKNHDCFIRCIDKLLELGANIFLDKEISKFVNSKDIIYCEDIYESINNSDIVIIIGGDGTIMKYSKISSMYGKKILGINMGRLGFISGIEGNELDRLSDLISGNYKIDKRILFEFSVEGSKDRFLSLNEVVLCRDVASQIIDYYIEKENNNIYKVRSDGLIISTPTGSTGYSMSAGGPIVEPGLDFAIITPLFPHSLNSRSLIVGLKENLKIKYKVRKNSNVNIISDGSSYMSSNSDGEIVIEKSDKKVEFICLKENRFYENLKGKLIK